MKTVSELPILRKFVKFLDFLICKNNSCKNRISLNTTFGFSNYAKRISSLPIQKCQQVKVHCEIVSSIFFLRKSIQIFSVILVIASQLSFKAFITYHINDKKSGASSILSFRSFTMILCPAFESIRRRLVLMMLLLLHIAQAYHRGKFSLECISYFISKII